MSDFQNKNTFSYVKFKENLIANIFEYVQHRFMPRKSIFKKSGKWTLKKNARVYSLTFFSSKNLSSHFQNKNTFSYVKFNGKLISTIFRDVQHRFMPQKSILKKSGKWTFLKKRKATCMYIVYVLLFLLKIFFIAFSFRSRYLNLFRCPTLLVVGVIMINNVIYRV